jgi:hypothetical protein
VVEDDFIIAMELELILVDAGAEESPPPFPHYNRDSSAFRYNLDKEHDRRGRRAPQLSACSSLGSMPGHDPIGFGSP